MSSREFAAGSKVIAILRLQPVKDEMTLTSALPDGDYQFNVYNVATHRAPRDRAGHFEAISQIAFQHLSRGCPNYEQHDLNWIYKLEPGKYSVTATRRPQRVISNGLGKDESLPTVVSNKVYFRVDP